MSSILDKQSEEDISHLYYAAVHIYELNMAHKWERGIDGRLFESLLRIADIFDLANSRPAGNRASMAISWLVERISMDDLKEDIRNQNSLDQLVHKLYRENRKK